MDPVNLQKNEVSVSLTKTKVEHSSLVVYRVKFLVLMCMYIVHAQKINKVYNIAQVEE